MALTPGQPPGATPLDPDEAAALLPASLTTQEMLNNWEAENILEAESWLATRARVDVLDERFIRALHARMFGRTWRWAGTFRTSGKNIGIAPELIAPAIRDLVLDVRAQVAAKAMPVEEIAARFHHRLTRIHPFANGNGRHARLVTDLLLRQLGAAPFTWGRGDLVHAGEVRSAYIAALRAADDHDLNPLLAFLGVATGPLASG